MTLRSYKQFKPFGGKRFLIRCNFDVSVDNGEVDKDSTWRIDASIPLLKELSDSGAKTVVISHRGRPEGKDLVYSLAPIVNYLKNKGLSVELSDRAPSEGEIIVRENVRFDARETENDQTLAKVLSELGEIFINDDFATAHRAHASTVGVAGILPSAAGPLLLREVDELSRARSMEGERLVVIIGGAKAETKVKLISFFIEKGATVITGGVIANTILKLRDVGVGRSLVDDSDIPDSIMRSEKLIAPSDVVVSTSLEKAENVIQKEVASVKENEYILDIGPESQKLFKDYIDKASYIIWNGPFGIVEIEEFRKGSQFIAESCTGAQAYTLAGGGDIVTFLSQEGLRDRFNYVSTGGGAMLSYLAGEELPALEVLKS